jgi:hypothetical protein
MTPWGGKGYRPMRRKNQVFIFVAGMFCGVGVTRPDWVLFVLGLCLCGVVLWEGAKR